ncbi:hypothetical protein D3C81_2189270 [compost metagenome]
MALTADQKEAMMASRGASAAPVAAKSGTKRYDVRFADGKGATVLDMTGEDEAEAIAGIASIFGPERVLSVVRQ